MGIPIRISSISRGRVNLSSFRSGALGQRLFSVESKDFGVPPLEAYRADSSIDLSKHHVPKTFLDKVAYRTVKLLRIPTYVFSQKRYGCRAMMLETVAAVPGRVGGMLLHHLRFLGRFQQTDGWIKALLEEADNERMHLMTMVELVQPKWYERLLLVTVQGVFFNAYFVLYLVSPRLAHRVVGYLEEEVIHSYTRYLKDIECGKTENVAAPAIAIDYWKLAKDATLRDVITVIRAEEAHHRDVNHFASMSFKTGALAQILLSLKTGDFTTGHEPEDSVNHDLLRKYIYSATLINLYRKNPDKFIFDYSDDVQKGVVRTVFGEESGKKYKEECKKSLSQLKSCTVDELKRRYSSDHVFDIMSKGVIFHSVSQLFFKGVGALNHAYQLGPGESMKDVMIKLQGLEERVRLNHLYKILNKIRVLRDAKTPVVKAVVKGGEAKAEEKVDGSSVDEVEKSVSGDSGTNVSGDSAPLTWYAHLKRIIWGSRGDGPGGDGGDGPGGSDDGGGD